MSYVDPVQDGGIPASGKVILSKQIGDMITDIEYFYTQYQAEAQARSTGDLNLQTQINTLISEVQSLQAAIYGTPIAPTVVTIPVISGLTTPTSQLTGTEGTWNNNPTSYTNQWFRNSIAILNATSINYTLTTADAGTNITFSVIANNGAGSSPASVSLPLSIPTVQTVPTLVTSPTISGGTDLGDVLTASGTWNNVTNYTYQWYRNTTAILNATNATYVVAAADQGETLTCQVTATNSSGPSEITTPGIAIPAVTIPINSGAPVITSESGTVVVGATLTTTTGNWTGTVVATTSLPVNNSLPVASSESGTFNVGDTMQTTNGTWS